MTTEKDCIAIQFTAACVTGRTVVSRHSAGLGGWSRRARAERAWVAQVAAGRSGRWASGARGRRAGGGGGGGGQVCAGPERGRARGSRRDRGGGGGCGLARDLGAWAVHSACFWPGSTRYFPESNFLDIVREPGS